MDRTDFIIPECYVDTNLVETLVCKGSCNHQKGCNQVAKVMQTKFADRFAVGIIDADKRRPNYLNEFKEIASSEHLTVLRHHAKAHFIILVRPAIDGFILSCVADADADMSKFGLSPVLKVFTSQTKNVMSNKDERFKRLFNEIKDSHEMSILKEVLSRLVADTYHVTSESIAVIFE